MQITRTLPTREHRAITGKTAVATVRWYKVCAIPEVFSAVASHSVVIYISSLACLLIWQITL